MLKEVSILLMSLWTLMSTQWTPGVVKVWFRRSVFSYRMVSVQPAVSSGTQLRRKRQQTHIGGLKTDDQPVSSRDFLLFVFIHIYTGVCVQLIK